MAYRISSALRLCSATPSGRVLKSTPSTAIREMRSSILFSTATVSCRSIRQELFLSGDS